MRVLWVNEEPDMVGGAERYIRDTVSLLNARGVCSSLMYDGLRPRVSKALFDVFQGVYPMVDIRRQVAEIAPDIIFVHRLPGKAAIRKFANAGVPVARFFHDFHMLCLRKHKYTALRQQTCEKPIGLRCYPCIGFVNRANNFLGVRIDRVGTMRAEQRANYPLDAFVVGSEFMGEHLAQSGFDRARIHVLPLYSPPPDHLPDVRREKDLVLFAGQVIRGKGLDTLLRAMTMIKSSARLEILGVGSQDAEFRGLAESLGVMNRVRFLGRLTHAELAEYYRRALCVVVPSRQPEPFGLVGTEAMSYGAPVIGSRSGAIPEWLDDGMTGLLVKPNDPVDLARAIDEMLSDPERARKMGDAGRARYLDRFQPARHVEGLHAVLEKLARERNAA